MTLGELRDKLLELSDETELDTEVWIDLDEYFSRKVNYVYIDFETGDLVIR